jgi:zinc protease
MRRTQIWLLGMGIAAAAAGNGLVAPAFAQLKISPLKYRERQLANGLHLLSIEDHASPTVAIHVWYKVGSKDDPAGRSGFAHLFEHLMFKKTKNMKDEMMDRLTEDVGGYNNAATGDDCTYYYEVVPSNFLETLLWAEGERLAALDVNEANFKSERDVVKEEFRQRILAPPYGKLLYLVEQKAFLKHPYMRPGIGSIEELNAASIEDVRAFHTTFYRPDNATLVVAGDFEPAQLDAWVDRYLGVIPKPQGLLPRVSVQEPPRQGERRFTEYGPNVPLPAVAISYLVPPITSKDAPALQILQALLSAGESSRLYQELVYRDQLAQEIIAEADLREDAGLFVLGAILASGKSVEAAEGILLSQMSGLQAGPVDPDELNKVKNQLITHELHERETSHGKASALAQAAVLQGNPARVNADIEDLGKVSAADVQRVAQNYFSESNRVVLHYLPESARKGRTANTSKTGGKR